VVSKGAPQISGIALLTEHPSEGAHKKRHLIRRASPLRQ
jgi:hypothetical protein